MTVTRLYHTPLSVAVVAARTCWDSITKSGKYFSPTDKLDSQDIELLEKLVKKYHHESVVEHCSVSFRIEGISRGCLQELARHRIQNLSVQSSRYTLKRSIATAPDFFEPKDIGPFFVLTDDPSINLALVDQAKILQIYCRTRKSNDIVKYLIPEALKTNLVSTWNIRSLRNFIKLRAAKEAHPEIRKLAIEIKKRLPNEWDVLFDDL